MTEKLLKRLQKFGRKSQRAKKYIRAGDIFQVVLSQSFTLPLQVEPFEIYRELRRVDPSPYLIFVRTCGAVLIGASPEILVRLEGERVDVRPIAGTRSRGANKAEDDAKPSLLPGWSTEMLSPSWRNRPR